eukprot:TRINITY_DN206_c0_g1_i1.p1 TRINITY_DN206_c0_g1~~TRINITY_DN206_c0_g1_i1.p1  ORF type:complete len:135 (-),score=15.46 TRINITY_DN206_c0_g1_i1:757-1161(-)
MLSFTFWVLVHEGSQSSLVMKCGVHVQVEIWPFFIVFLCCRNVRRPVPPFWRRNANVGITRQVEQATSWGGNNNSMEVDYVDPVPQKPRTLDSRFASLKERRNGTQQVVTFNATEQNRRRNVVTNGAGRRRPTA